MTYEQNLKAILDIHLSVIKDEVKDNIIDSILRLKTQEESGPLLDGMRNTAFVCGCRGEDVEFKVHQALKRMGRDDLLPPCERCKDESENKKYDNLWMLGLFCNGFIKEKITQLNKEAEEAGMTLTEYLESISPLNEAKKETKNDSDN